MNPNSSSEKRVQNLRSRLREEAGQAMIAAAEAVFAERGLSGASMGEIAAEAGVAVGTLYNHFQDREALLDATMAARKAELKDKLDKRLHESAREPFARQLGAIIGALFEHFEEHRQFLTIVMCEHATSLGKKSKAMREIASVLERVLKRGVQEGALKPSRGGLHAVALLGMVRGVILNDVEHGSRGELTRHVDELVDLFLRGAGR